MIADKMSETNARGAELRPFTEGEFGREIYRAPAPLSCPFCASEDGAQVCQMQDADSDCCAVFKAICVCGAEGPPGASQIEAAEQWNRRGDPRVRSNKGPKDLETAMTAAPGFASRDA
jgi:hypothetical protein